MDIAHGLITTAQINIEKWEEHKFFELVIALSEKI